MLSVQKVEDGAIGVYHLFRFCSVWYLSMCKIHLQVVDCHLIDATRGSSSDLSPNEQLLVPQISDYE